jgi:PleD family two-component response regulator
MEADMSFSALGSTLGYETSSVLQVRQQSSTADNSKTAPVVFIIDADRAVRESLELLIRIQGWRSETFASAEDFLVRPLELVPSCLLVDAFMPGLSSLALQKRAAVEHPQCRSRGS